MTGRIGPQPPPEPLRNVDWAALSRDIREATQRLRPVTEVLTPPGPTLAERLAEQVQAILGTPLQPWQMRVIERNLTSSADYIVRRLRLEGERRARGEILSVELVSAELVRDAQGMMYAVPVGTHPREYPTAGVALTMRMAQQYIGSRRFQIANREAGTEAARHYGWTLLGMTPEFDPPTDEQEWRRINTFARRGAVPERPYTRESAGTHGREPLPTKPRVAKVSLVIEYEDGGRDIIKINGGARDAHLGDGKTNVVVTFSGVRPDENRAAYTLRHEEAAS